MVNLKDYEQYKAARLSEDFGVLDAMETDNSCMFGVYEKIYDYEELQEHIKELNKQRNEEKRYQRWVADHGYDIRNGKMSDEGFRASFTLSGTVDFYARYKKELKEGAVCLW